MTFLFNYHLFFFFWLTPTLGWLFLFLCNHHKVRHKNYILFYRNQLRQNSIIREWIKYLNTPPYTAIYGDKFLKVIFFQSLHFLWKIIYLKKIYFTVRLIVYNVLKISLLFLKGPQAWSINVLISLWIFFSITLKLNASIKFINIDNLHKLHSTA